MFPIGEPLIPSRITCTPRDGVDKSGNRRPERGLYVPTMFLIAPGPLDLSHLLVGAAIGRDFTLFDGLD